MKTMEGLSLVEILVYCVVFAISCGIAAPALNSMLLSIQETQATNQMLSILHYARGSAVFERVTTGICAGENHCSQQSRWSGQVLVFADRNANGSFDSGEKLLHVGHLEDGYTWRWSNFRNRAFAQFEANGTTRALNGTLTLCHENKAVRQIVISLAGRPRSQPPAVGARCS